MKKKNVIRIILVTAGIVIGGMIYGVYFISEMIRDAYAQEWVADLVIDYLKTHHNTWPIADMQKCTNDWASRTLDTCFPVVGMSHLWMGSIRSSS